MDFESVACPQPRRSVGSGLMVYGVATESPAGDL